MNFDTYVKFYKACGNGDLNTARQLWHLSRMNVWLSPLWTGTIDGFSNACRAGHLHVARWLLTIDPTIYTREYVKHVFVWVCANGQLSIAKWLLFVQPSICVSDYCERAFRMACERGLLNVAKWLVSVKPEIDCVSVCTTDVFHYTCCRLQSAKLILSINPAIHIDPMSLSDLCCEGKLHVIKWLLMVNPTIDISENNEEAFRWACYYGRLSVAKWLLCINPTFDVIGARDNIRSTAALIDNSNVEAWLTTIIANKRPKHF